MVFSSACVLAAVGRSSVRDVPRGAHASASNVSLADVGNGFRDKHRLRKTDEFSSVFAFRRVIRGNHFDLLYRPNTLATARLGLVVAKKFVHSAVKRNLVKRVVRESFRLARMGLQHHDIVVRVSNRMNDCDRNALRSEIDSLFDRLAQ
jgi:ribonuclease P protein component